MDNKNSTKSTLVRLDKFVSDALIIGRKDASVLIKRARVSVNGSPVKTPDLKINPDNDTVLADGKQIGYRKFIYIMLNKPKGLVCSNDDRKDGTVMSIFPKEYLDKGISTVGRLDKDTVGLLLVTNDGELSHTLLSPKKHAEKVYFVRTDKPFEKEDAETMKKGIVIEGKNTVPAKLELLDDKYTALVTLTEGKFHEVKRLCYACGQKEVLHLKRISFANLKLDETLAEGEWRELRSEEIKMLCDRKIQ